MNNVNKSYKQCNQTSVNRDVVIGALKFLNQNFCTGDSTCRNIRNNSILKIKFTKQIIQNCSREIRCLHNN